MRTFWIVVIVLLTAAAAWSQKDESLDALKQRAAAASPGDQPKLFLEIAHREYKMADGFYKAGDSDKGKAAVAELTDYCEKAATTASQSGKHLKHTELKVRELARHLDAMRKTLAFDDRAPVQTAVERLEKLRSDLLARMFEPKKKS